MLIFRVRLINRHAPTAPAHLALTERVVRFGKTYLANDTVIALAPGCRLELGGPYPITDMGSAHFLFPLQRAYARNNRYVLLLSTASDSYRFEYLLEGRTAVSRWDYLEPMWRERGVEVLRTR